MCAHCTRAHAQARMRTDAWKHARSRVLGCVRMRSADVLRRAAARRSTLLPGCAEPGGACDVARHTPHRCEARGGPKSSQSRNLIAVPARLDAMPMPVPRASCAGAAAWLPGWGLARATHLSHGACHGVRGPPHRATARPRGACQTATRPFHRAAQAHSTSIGDGRRGEQGEEDAHAEPHDKDAPQHDAGRRRITSPLLRVVAPHAAPISPCCAAVLTHGML